MLVYKVSPQTVIYEFFLFLLAGTLIAYL
jgi:hypothetical protein